MTAQARTEGSVSFSLKELSRLEEERVATERSEARHREEEAQRRAREAERRAHEEAEARARADEERRAEEERRAREEEARLEGMKRAFVERERIAAAETARATELEHRRRHELELERVKSEHRAGLAPWAVAAVASAALVGFVATYALVLAPRAEARVAQANAAAAASADAMGDARRRLDDLAQRVDGLGAELKASREREGKLESDLTEAQKELERRGVHTPPRAPQAPGAAPPKDPFIHGKCKDGDPFCVDK